jgi:hypothetical protein
MSAFSRLASALRSVPSWAARYLDNRLAAIETSIAGLSADGTFDMSSPVVGNAVYGDSADHVALADADNASKIPAIGVVAEVVSPSSALVRFCGIVTSAGSFTAWAPQYLSATAGALTETPPSAPHAAIVGVAINTTDLLVLPIGPVFSFLKSVTANLGGDILGYSDPSSKTTAATIPTALDALFVDRLSSNRAAVMIPLSAWRIVSSGGDVGNISAIGGVLASNSDPILLGDGNNSWEISWAANSVVPIGVQIPLPPDIDDTGDAYLDLDVYSGTTNAATMAIASSWNGGSEVTDSADDSGTKSATRHRITGTIGNSDIPSGAKHVTFRLTPPAHSTDAIKLVGTLFRYTPKLLT